MASPSSRPDPDLYQRARRLARDLRSPVYISDGQVVTQRPPKTVAMVWPNGSVTWGNASGSDRRSGPSAA